MEWPCPPQHGLACALSCAAHFAKVTYLRPSPSDARQALAFVGRASLAVQSGEVAVQGAVLTPASGAVELCADERGGGAALVEPGAGVGTVPLAASGAAVFTLTRLPGSSSSSSSAPPGTPRQQAQGAQGETQRQLGFEAWLASDPTAPRTPPPLPPLWHQAAGEVGHTLQQQQQQLGGVGGPAVIAVCGAKKVGKSTFARFLANALLSQHPCVAYLDTGKERHRGGRREG